MAAILVPPVVMTGFPSPAMMLKLDTPTVLRLSWFIFKKPLVATCTRIEEKGRGGGNSIDTYMYTYIM